MRILQLVLLVLACFSLASCSLFYGVSNLTVPMYHYRRVEPAAYLGSRPMMPIYVDSSFTAEQKQIIAGVITEWDYVLNGYITIKVLDWNFDRKSKEGLATIDRIEKTSQGIIMLNLRDDDPLLEDTDTSRTLAFVDALGNQAHILGVLSEHIGTRSWHDILLHEFGHALGAMHVNAPSSLYPYNDGDKQLSCVDKITAQQVSTYHHLDVEHLNYCLTPDFE